MDEAAQGRVIAQFDEMIPRSLIVKVLAAYEHEMWRAEVAKNPRIMALVKLKVGGRGIPWPWAQKTRLPRSKSEGCYLQSVDRYRAQDYLGEPDAQWQVYNGRDAWGTRGHPYVRRVR